MAEIICPQCKAANKDTARYCSECGTSFLSSTPLSSELPTNEPSLQTSLLLQDRYRIVIELGRGGFGAVYRAWDTRLNKAVAVKENMETSPEAQRQFAREALVLASLSHPNLPRVTDHFSLPDQGQYLVMDFVEGNDLETQVRTQGVIPVEQALAWIIQVTDALDYLHSQEPPVFHRDIKPANVRITPKGKAMLVDFGLVKVSAPQMKTTMGARAISPGYAPPEQYGQGRTDARTDIYALAATLYRLVTGNEPLESVLRITGDSLIPAAKVNNEVPAQVSQTIERGMALDPEKRFPSADAFRSALHRGFEAIRATTFSGARPAVEPAHTFQAQPFVEAPIYPVSKSPREGEVPRTQVVSSEQLSQEQPSSAASGTPLRTQVVENFPMGQGLTQGNGVRMPPTARMEDIYQEWAATPAQQQLTRGVPRWLLFAGIGGIVVLLLSVAVVVGLSLSDGGTSNKTATAEILDTMVARVESTNTKIAQDALNRQNTATAQMKQSATAQYQASHAAVLTSTAMVKAERTSTAQVKSQAESQATIQVLNSILSPLGINATPSLVFGPNNGSLIHDPSDGSLSYECASVSVQNFLAQVNFIAPYKKEIGYWDFGVLFRAQAKGLYRLAMFIGQQWELENYIKEKKEYVPIAKGDTNRLKTNEGDANLIQVVGMNNQGWLLVNGVQFDKFDLSDMSDSGDVCIAVGFYTNTEISGKETPYSAFTVWELR